MVKIKFIVVDRTRSSFIREGENLYLKRLRHYTHIEWEEVKAEKIRKGVSDEEVLKKEGQAILRRLRPNDYKIALDRTGKQYNSKKLASWLQQLSVITNGRACFIIGGPVGLSEEVKETADMIFSLSKLTLTHEMSRLILLEQIYRSFTIIEGYKYHR